MRAFGTKIILSLFIIGFLAACSNMEGVYGSPFIVPAHKKSQESES